MKSVIHVGTNGLTLSGIVVEGSAGVCGVILILTENWFVMSRTGGSSSATGMGVAACLCSFLMC